MGNIFTNKVTITSRAKGKSSGARVITVVKVLQEKVYLSAIYNKNEQNDTADKGIKINCKVFTPATDQNK